MRFSRNIEPRSAYSQGWKRDEDVPDKDVRNADDVKRTR